MDSDTFWLALGLFLVIEGCSPLLSPRLWRRTVLQVLQFSDGQLRFFGMCSILAGALLIGLLL